jgi:predicted dehydrogenase
MSPSRRSFIIKSAAGAAALACPPRLRAMAANSDIRLGVLGVGSQVKLGGKGLQDALVFAGIPGVRVVAMCDCDSDNLARGVATFEKRGQKVKAYRDFRELLDDKEIDAVTIATPNHWHALMAMLACAAGKDVFVQKPSTHFLHEGRMLIRAAQKYHRIVQATHGWRGSGPYAEGIEYAASGQLGRMTCIRGINYKARLSIGKVSGPQPVPAACDYDLWCGPAVKKPLLRKNLHYDWHWDWTTGDGDLGNMGIHFMDACRWAGGYRQLPPHVVSVGGRFGYEDDGQTPNTLITYFDYPVPIVFEVRGLPQNATLRQGDWGRNPKQTMDSYRDVQLGAIIECEGGVIRDKAAYDNDGKLIREFTRRRVSTEQNFIDCVRSRKADELFTDATEGHLSCGLVHLANISYRAAGRTPGATSLESITANKGLAGTFERMKAHLAANGIDSDKAPLTLGAMALDPQTERFTDGTSGDLGNHLAVPEYRQPFVAPDLT